ncbi:MAG: sulfotransferase [Acidimicrobiia bacterium]|nr:sulfotransferase [Acidimicrobiia bacterium]
MTTTPRRRPATAVSASKTGRAAAYAARVLRYRALAGAGALPRVGSRSYTRFVIVGRGRSGTNFVRGLLDSHPGAVVHGELFRDFDAPQPGVPRLLQSRRAWRRKREDPVAFLHRSVFRPFPDPVGAVGFKLFDDQARDGRWKAVWEHVIADDGLRVVHVVRRDRLATLVSLRLAEASGTWVNGRALGTVTLSPSECAEFFTAVDAAEARLRADFPDHRRREVAYEDLLADPEPLLRDVQRFLDLPARPLVPTTIRQSRRPLPAVVTNFEALRAHFAGTAWARFFG